MSNNDRIKERVLGREIPNDITPRELKTLMRSCNFEVSNKDSGGSHYSFKHVNLDYLVTVPMHNPIKPAYIKLVKKAILEIEGKSNEQI